MEAADNGNGDAAGGDAADAADALDQIGLMDAAENGDAAAAAAIAAVDWDDRLSWEDSERFEEDSLCSWLSEPESLIQNWRGWSNNGANDGQASMGNNGGQQGQGGRGNSSHTGGGNGGGGGGGLGSSGGSHRHHHHHSSGRGGACSSPNHHLGSNALNYNGGLLAVGGSAGARQHSADHHNHGQTKIFSLVELTAREVARSVPFELVERFYPPVPETLQLRVAFWSFPENEEDIRLYSCLANGNVEEFQKGDLLYRNRAVKDLLQIGFHLSGLVYQSSTSGGVSSGAVSKRESSNNNGGRYGHWSSSNAGGGGGGGGGHSSSNNATSSLTSTSPQCYNVAVTLDRRRITSCTCTCRPSMTAAWCSHVVAVCLHRIQLPETVCLRAPVSESLSRLQRDQLQKFAQYLISELPRQILPTAQRLLDDLLSQSAPINTVSGAPDPTAGASLNEASWWCLDDGVLHENIRKILVKFCQPSPTVFSDVNYLSSSAPPAASEWQSLMRPLRGREPEGLWNLLSIVREMYKRHDSNAAKLLRVITTECLNCDQVVLWWYHTKLSQSLNGPQVLPGCALVLTSSSSTGGGKSNNGGGNGGSGALGGQTHSAQYSCASLLDEIVVFWRLLVLNPSLSPDDRRNFAHELRHYHTKAVEKVYRILGGANPGTVINAGGQNGAAGGGGHENHQGGGGGGGHNNHHHHHGHHGGSNHHHHHHHHHHSSNTLNIPGGGKLTWETARFDPQTFPGFLPALEASLIDWIDYPIDGITYEPPRGRSPSYGSACGYLVLKDFVAGSSTGNQQQQSLVSPASISSTSTMDGMVFVGGVPVLREKQLRSLSVLKPNEKEEAAASGSGAGARPKSTASKHQQHQPSVKPKYDDIDRIYLPEAQADDENAQENGENRRRPSTSNQQAKRKTPNDWADEAFKELGTRRDELEILSARCESLYAHGYRTEAVELAAHLARRLMQNPPDLMVETPIVAAIPSAPVASGVSTVVATTAATAAVAIPAASVQHSASASVKHPAASSSSTLASGRKKKRAANIQQPSSHYQYETIFVHPRAMEVSQLASATLARAIFLFSVMAEDADYRQLAFQIGLWALELPRQPAATKFLEVKMHYQESEIVNMLKQLPLGADEMEMLRQRALRLRLGAFHHRHPTTVASSSVSIGGASSNLAATSSSSASKLPPVVLPLNLASYVFEALSWPTATPIPTAGAASSLGGVLNLAPSSSGGHQSIAVALSQRANAYRAPGDEQLAFEAAVAALAMKSNVSEAEHPLLCEGIRRQKGDLALALLLRYRDHQEKLAVIMDRLLDHEMHQMYKHHSSNAIYYGHHLRSSSTTASSAAAASNVVASNLAAPNATGSTSGTYQQQSNVQRQSENQTLHPQPSGTESQASDSTAATIGGASGVLQQQQSQSCAPSRSSSTACFDEVDSEQNNTGEVSQLSEALDDMALLAPEDEEDYDLDEDIMSARGEDDGSPFWMGRGDAADVNGNKANGAAGGKKRHDGSISDDVLSTAASSSDDSSSSGISTGGGGSRLVNVAVGGQMPAANQNQQHHGGAINEAAVNQNHADIGNGAAMAPAAAIAASGPVAVAAASAPAPAVAPKSVDPLNKACYVKLSRHRRYVTPSIPNQPSEAHAHFMMELAKRLLIEAGGSHSTAIFTSQGSGPQANQGHGGGPHRQLHLCAFQIGLYSLGIHNKVTPNWLSRTYSSHVSWISGNAMEIGRTAIRILIDTWENHLTPTEAATLADKASQSRDLGMIQAAAELALSTLPQAHALNPTEIFRALTQCKEQPTPVMLEKACLAVEQAAKDYGVYPEVLFRVAQTWYQLYADSTAASATSSNAGGTNAAAAMEHFQHQSIIGHFGDPNAAVHPQALGMPPMQLLHQPHHPSGQMQQQQHHEQQHPSFGGHYHHHHAFGNGPRHPMSGGPPPPPPIRGQMAPPMCPPSHPQNAAAAAMIHHQQQQQMAAAYGMHPQHMGPPGPFMLRPPSASSANAPNASNVPPAMAGPMHHGSNQQFQGHGGAPSLHHPPPQGALGQPPPPQQGVAPPPGAQPYFQQAAAAAALMNAYHHPYTVAQLAAVNAAVSRNYNGPIVHQQLHPSQMQQRGAQHQLPPPPPGGPPHHHPNANSYNNAMAHLHASTQQSHQQQQAAADKHVDQAGGQSRFLYAAYRVGMLALETLGRRINDDRAFTKYSQNPTYGDDVKWLLKISRRLGLMYVQQFCLVAAQSVPSPFVLWDLASEVAMLFSRSTSSGGGGGAGAPPMMPGGLMPPPPVSSSIGGGPSSISQLQPPPPMMTQIDLNVSSALGPTSTMIPPPPQGGPQAQAAAAMQHQMMAAVAAGHHPPAILFRALQHPHVQPLVHRCHQMFYMAAQQKLSHPRFMPADTEEVCALVKAARTAFLHTPNGHVNFNDFLQSLRRQKACKKDVWNKILSHLNG